MQKHVANTVSHPARRTVAARQANAEALKVTNEELRGRQTTKAREQPPSYRTIKSDIPFDSSLDLGGFTNSEMTGQLDQHMGSPADDFANMSLQMDEYDGGSGEYEEDESEGGSDEDEEGELKGNEPATAVNLEVGGFHPNHPQNGVSKSQGVQRSHNGSAQIYAAPQQQQKRTSSHGNTVPGLGRKNDDQNARAGAIANVNPFPMTRKGLVNTFEPQNIVISPNIQPLDINDDSDHRKGTNRSGHQGKRSRKHSSGSKPKPTVQFNDINDFEHQPVDELDYSEDKLKKRPFTELKREPFDFDPSRNDISMQDIVGTLDERLVKVRKLQPEEQRAFFESLPISDWDQAGDWFLGQFTELMGKMRDARKMKRDIAQKFEEEVSQRHVVVENRQSGILSTMNGMKTSGQAALRAASSERTPGPS